jgi:hypothetical protein
MLDRSFTIRQSHLTSVGPAVNRFNRCLTSGRSRRRPAGDPERGDGRGPPPPVPLEPPARPGPAGPTRPGPSGSGSLLSAPPASRGLASGHGGVGGGAGGARPGRLPRRGEGLGGSSGCGGSLAARLGGRVPSRPGRVGPGSPPSSGWVGWGAARLGGRAAARHQCRGRRRAFTARCAARDPSAPGPRARAARWGCQCRICLIVQPRLGLELEVAGSHRPKRAAAPRRNSEAVNEGDSSSP